MSAKVRFINGVEATVTDYEWKCEDKVCLELLQSFTPEQGPSGEEVNPDNELAKALAEELDLEVVELGKDDKGVEGRIH